MALEIVEVEEDELRLEEVEVSEMCRSCGCGREETPKSAGPGRRSHAHRHSHPPGPESDRGAAASPASEPVSSSQHVDSRPRPRLRPPPLPISHTRSVLRTVRLQRELLEKNDAIAAATRRRLAGIGVRMFNLIGGPGAGKTAILEATIRRLAGRVPLAVLEGDQATELDAERIRRAGCHALQINTGAGCHLDAEMVIEGVRAIAPGPRSVVFVENVGNLVCPALFDIGEQAKVVVMSVTEGDDKPLKYARAFRAADVFLLTKVDLLGGVDFDVERCATHALSANPALRIISVSAKAGTGIDEWCAWVESRRDP